MIRRVLTLAYEGGHPDHDSVQLPGGTFGERYRFRDGRLRCITGMPDGSRSSSSFVSSAWRRDVDVRPTADEQERKREMCQAYALAGRFSVEFDVAARSVRPQIAYDYTRPPHEGKPNYEAWQMEDDGGRCLCRVCVNSRAVRAKGARG